MPAQLLRQAMRHKNGGHCLSYLDRAQTWLPEKTRHTPDWPSHPLIGTVFSLPGTSPEAPAFKIYRLHGALVAPPHPGPASPSFIKPAFPSKSKISLSLSLPILAYCYPPPLLYLYPCSETSWTFSLLSRSLLSLTLYLLIEHSELVRSLHSTHIDSYLLHICRHRTHTYTVTMVSRASFYLLLCYLFATALGSGR